MKEIHHRASYEWDFNRPTKEFILEDLNRPGHKSLTNDMANALTEIFFNHSEVHAYNVMDFKITYRDSTGRWDGVKVESFKVDPDNGAVQVLSVSFYPLPPPVEP
jgi:hypothetical protein